MRDPVLRPRNAVPFGKKTAQDAFAPEFHPRGWRFHKENRWLLRAFSQAVTDETLMRSPLRHAPFPFFRNKAFAEQRRVDDAEHNFPVQAVGHGRDGQGQAVGKIGCAVHGIDDPAGIRQAQIFRALFSEESGLGRQGCKAFFQECLHSDIGFRYRSMRPLWRIVWGWA